MPGSKLPNFELMPAESRNGGVKIKMYVIWYLIFCLIIAYILNALWKVKFADSIAIGQLGIIVNLYLFYLIDLLETGIYITLGVLSIVFIGTVILTILKKTALNVLKDIVGYPLLGYTLYLLISYITIWDNAPFWTDELVYWAALPKVLYQYHGSLQLKHGFQIFSVDYMPGISIYQYFLQFLNKSWNDSLLFFGYAAITGALILPVGKNIRKWHSGIGLGIALYFIPLFFFHTKANDYAVFYQSLYIDPILGTAAGCLIWLFMQKPWKNRISFIQYIFYSSFIVLLKSSGIAFILVESAAMLIYILLYERSYFKKWWIWLGSFFPIILWLFWEYALKYYHIGKEIKYNIGGIFQSAFVKPFLTALAAQDIFTSWVENLNGHFSFMACFLIVSFLLICMLRPLTRQKIAMKRLLFFTYGTVFVQILVYVIGLYGLCSGTWEGQLHSFNRYISTVLEMAVCFFMCILVSEWQTIYQEIRINKISRALSCMCIVVVIIIAPIKHFDNTANVFPDYIAEDCTAVNQIFENVKTTTPEGWKSVSLLYDEPVWTNEYASWVGWAKEWYAYLLHLISYQCIDKGIQVRLTPYYSSQINMEYTEMGGVICSFNSDTTWMNTDYIIMLHGSYVETPIHNWELYEVEHAENSQIFLRFIAAGSKPETFVNYHSP